LISDVWKNIEKMYEMNHSVYLSRECQNFLANFIIKLETNEKIKQILEVPLNSLTSNTKLNFNLAIDLIIKILEIILKSRNNEILSHFQNGLEKTCNELLTPDQDTAQLVKVACVLSLLAFALTETSTEHLALLEEKILNIIAHLITTKNISAVQTTLWHCQNYWGIIKPRVLHLAIAYQLDHQLLYLQVCIYIYISF
jgi:hypothetical protein